MKSLILDCSAGMSVYVLNDDKIYSKVDNNQKKHTDELLVCVDELLKNANIKISDIENVCVCIGPGSFTGIRVAISICKGLVVGSNIKVFIATNFEIMEQSDSNNVFYILEGFSKFVYVKKVQNGLVLQECMELEKLILELKNSNSEIYVQNEKVQNLLKIHEINSYIAKNETILRFLDKIKNDECVDLNTIEPVYLRASQAEMEHNSKLAGEK